jgi:hypothetical protein
VSTFFYSLCINQIARNIVAQWGIFGSQNFKNFIVFNLKAWNDVSFPFGIWVFKCIDVPNGYISYVNCSVLCSRGRDAGESSIQNFTNESLAGVSVFGKSRTCDQTW